MKAEALIVKEFRALLPAWTAGLVAIGAAFVSSSGWVLLLSALGYAVAAIALGVQTVGHEYTNRTVGLLLVQPVDRKRILAIKLVVLFCLLSVLGAAAWLAPFNAETWHRPWVWKHPTVTLLPLVAGFFIAPWITMVSRNPLAGVVFTASVPGMLMFGGELIGIARFGVGHPDVDAFRDQFWLRAMILVLRWYRVRIGSQLGQRCVFEPSCSRYAELAFRERGLVFGSVLVVRRLSRCRPGQGGVDLP